MSINYSFKCALASTFIFIAIKLSTFLTHTQLEGIGIYSGLIALALTIIPLYFGIKHKRDSELGGYITVRQVMVAGIVISLQTCILVSVYTYLHYSYIDTELIVKLCEEAKRQGTEQHKSTSEIQAKIIELTEFYSPFKQATVALTGILGTGTVLSFILSTFLIKNPEN